MTEPWDVVIVGGGHNALVAAFYLARAGLRTLVLERREIVGGACVTEEFAPGYRASPGAYVLSMLRGAVWRDLRLRERGLRVDQCGPSLNLHPNGQMFTLHADLGQAVDAIRPLSEADARAFPCYEAKLARIAMSLEPLLDRTAPDPRLRGVHDLRAFARLAPFALRHRRDIPDLAYLFTTSAKQFLDEHFQAEILKSALGWESISNTYAGPSTPGTAHNLLHEAASGGSGGGVGWGFVPGGMGTLTTLMANAAREAGAIIRTGTEVCPFAIAAALVMKPMIIVADEPVSMLDVSIRAEVLQVLDRLRRSMSAAVLMITHDLSTAAHYADRIAVMYLGRIVEIGPAKQVVRAPRHPYTRALIAAVPHVTSRQESTTLISGEVPDGSAIPPGCRFHPRCPVALSECSYHDPDFVTAGPGHVAACVLAS